MYGNDTPAYKTVEFLGIVCRLALLKAFQQTAREMRSREWPLADCGYGNGDKRDGEPKRGSGENKAQRAMAQGCPVVF